ncbi:sensor histidine kinase [Cellulosimicrobium cellulans]|uniref:sensor histidine kinase n=1 Tax=Cellulosimicrobium cellulans TaxID=1710 RepID=UPI002405FB14|nr:histidine kinase [Cellulosimicrobium cellulans]MDF9875959.1 signal transduction histidine kinase [Cellulosimicrobium cellulans]
MGPLDRRRPRAFLAVVLAVVSVLGSVGATHGQPGARPLDLAAIALLLVSPLALVLLVPRPVVAVAVSVAAAGTFLVAGYAWGPVLAGPVGVLVGVLLSGSAERGRRVAWGGAVLLAGAVVTAAALRPDAPPRATLLGGAAWTVVVLLVAGGIRDRSARIAAAREAEQVARAERERTAVADERLRIAREVHDVLAHSLSAITVQAGVGLHLLDRDPDQARSALTAIRATSTEALDEVRAVLGVVRGESRTGAPVAHDMVDDGAPLAPTWDLAALPRLVRQAEGGGLTVALDVGPAAADLPDRLAGVVYRVVQEALTNVRRHAHGATHVDVRVVVDADDGGSGSGTGTGTERSDAGADGGRASRHVTVTVTDDGTDAASDPEPGYGLRGMRERVESVDGSLVAGPVPGPAPGAGAGSGTAGRGFRVRAVFPWPGTTPRPSTTRRSDAGPPRREEAP